MVGCVMPITENFSILPTNVQYPYFDVMKLPGYAIVYVMQMYSKMSVVLIDGALDTIIPAFMCQALGQLDILAYNLENIQFSCERALRKKKLRNKDDGCETITSNPKYVDSFDGLLKEKLGKYIKHHGGIIIYVSKIEAAFSTAAAIQFMLSGLVICLIGIQILSIEEPMNHIFQLLWTLVYFICMMSEVFMLCWFGDEIIWKSMHLQQAAFNSHWSQYPEDIKMSIKIFMERTKRPLRLTAGKIFILSLDTFTNLLKWSYNAFAVIRTMK